MGQSLTRTAGLILAASSSNAGKTTLSLALQRLFHRRGLIVSPAKCGPDYIDPAFHAVASGKPSLNLDSWAMTSRDILVRSNYHAAISDILFVEGVMGLFDGAAGGQGSTANLARILKLPILLVLDVKGQAQTAAAIADGICKFAPDVHVGGVLLNRVGSAAHETLLRDAFGAIDLPVFGAIRSSDSLSLPARHLGLVQAGEYDALSTRIDQIADHVGQYVDLDAILELANDRPKQPSSLPSGQTVKRLPPLGQRIAIAKDAAFTFLYPHILEDWKEHGAELSFFSPLADEAPQKEADAIYLPGGYPELHLDILSATTHFRRAMTAAAGKQKCIFGECGGYMVLGQSIESESGITHPMLGLLPLRTSFSNPKLHLGYRKLSLKGNLSWPEHLMAHEFHYANIISTEQADSPLFDAETASGKKLDKMGHSIGNVHGSFAHIIAPA